MTDGAFPMEEELICQPWLANKDSQLKSKKSPVRKTSHSPRHHISKVPAQWLNIPCSICTVSERYKRGDCGHSQQEICMRGNRFFRLDSIGVNTVASRLASIRVDDILLFDALAGLDEKNFRFSNQRGAVGPREKLHQHPDLDSAAIYTMHAPLQAVAENAAHHTVPVSLACFGQCLNQGQHLCARAVPLNLHLKSEPLKDFIQTRWKTDTCGK